MVGLSVHVSNFVKVYRTFCLAPSREGRELFERLRIEARRLAL